MNTITTKDGVEIFYKDWAKVSPSCSAMEGRNRRYRDPQHDHREWLKSEGEPSFAETHPDGRVAP